MPTSLRYSGTEIYDLRFNGTDIMTAKHNDVPVYAKRYNLSGQYNYQGAFVSINRVQSPNGIASNGSVYPGTRILYYGDTISLNVELDDGYGNAVLTVNGTQYTIFPVPITVTQDITYSLSYQQIGEVWHEVWYGWTLLIDSSWPVEIADYAYNYFALGDSAPTRIEGSVVDWIPACSGGYFEPLEELYRAELPYTSIYLDSIDGDPHLFQRDNGLYGWYQESEDMYGKPTWGRGFYIEIIQQKY